MKKTIVVLPFILAAADQAIKALVRRVPQGHVFLRVEPFFELTHYTNTGAAFSLFSGNPMAIGLMTLLLLAALFMVLRGLNLSARAWFALACLIGGGLGNLIDRLLLGGVTDYIHLLPVRFPVFNFADICITLSIGYLMIQMLRGRLELPTEEGHEPEQQERRG